MPRSKSSARWLKEHFDDEFVRRAQAEGLRSRAAFKLDELLDRDRLLKPVLSRPQGGRVEGPGMTVVDLGAAPGGWSQLVRQRLGDAGHVFALDILPMQGIGGGVHPGRFPRGKAVRRPDGKAGRRPGGPCAVGHGAQYQRYSVGGPGPRDGVGGAGRGFRIQVFETRRVFSGEAVSGPRFRRVPAWLARGLRAGDTAQAQGFARPFPRGLCLGDGTEEGSMSYAGFDPQADVRGKPARDVRVRAQDVQTGKPS